MATILTRSAIYLGKNLFSSQSSVTCPEIETVAAEIKNGIGTYNLPAGINAMSVSITLYRFDKDVFAQIANPFSEINMTVYGEIDTFSNETLSKSGQARLVLRGSSQKFGLLDKLKQQENMEQTIEFNISAAKLTVVGSEKYNTDIPNLIWKVGGVDILTTIKKNLALN